MEELHYSIVSFDKYVRIIGRNVFDFLVSNCENLKKKKIVKSGPIWGTFPYFRRESFYRNELLLKAKQSGGGKKKKFVKNKSNVPVEFPTAIKRRGEGGGKAFCSIYAL